MDLDGDVACDDFRELRGFRRRWNAPQVTPSEQSGPLEQTLHDEQHVHADEGQFEALIGDDQHALQYDIWEQVSLPADVDTPDRIEGTGKRLFDSLFDVQEPEPIQVLDPHNRESHWKTAAIEAEVKRMRSGLQKLPWEFEGTAFRQQDKWHGTCLAAFDKLFTPAAVGASDVLCSQVVFSRPNSVSLQSDLPVIPISLKKARREPLDEDVRRKALLRLRDLILQDPLATKLGSHLCEQLEQGCMHEEVEQSVRDAFRMKASTLQKRAASLWKLTRYLKEIGQLQPFRLSEAQLYVTLCRMRESGAGATTGQHVVEALHFLDAATDFAVVDLSEVVSSRCKGVARDMYLTKTPLRQKVPLTVEQVRHLELTMQLVGPAFRCIIGQLLFCIHACCRWRDAQRLKSISAESGHGETLLHASALASKTAVTVEARTRFLPYAAIGTGVSTVNWADLWLEARDAEGLGFAECVQPSFSERQACWLETPMSASEATAWLRDFLHGTAGFKPEQVGSHSCKTTLLTWAGRCVRVPFSPSERRLLGHHLDPNMKSVLCYSRESFTTLYSKVLSMLRLIRSGEFCPDQSAIERVVQMADAAGEGHPPGDGDGADDQVHSDSDSSAASVETEAGDVGGEERVEEPCVSLFPDFPGVLEADLFVHNLSGLVHVANEDDTMLCGRPTSVNFRQYAKVMDRDHLASCRQCLRAFQNRKS